MATPISCQKLVEAGFWEGGNCCLSCHDEWEIDADWYKPLEVTLSPEFFLYACCNVANAYHDSKLDVASILTYFRAQQARG